MFYKIGNSRVVHNGSVFVFVLFVFWQFVVGITAICCGNFCNLSAAVGSRFIVPTYTYSPRIRNPFEMPSRNVRNVFILCMLHIRMQKYGFWRAKTPFLHCKNPLFGVQEVGFCKALISRWLHCFCVSGRCSNTINVRNRRYS